MAIFPLTEQAEDDLARLSAQLSAVRVNPTYSRGDFLDLLERALYQAYVLGWEARQDQLENTGVAGFGGEE
jgi:hypothetical protein